MAGRGKQAASGRTRNFILWRLMESQKLRMVLQERIGTAAAAAAAAAAAFQHTQLNDDIRVCKDPSPPQCCLIQANKTIPATE